ncbi:MAG: hypothetical protein WAX77_07390 [Methylococcaceae bacterium]
MTTRIELENQLMNEIHYLPTEIIEEMLKWVSAIKKTTHSNTTENPEPILAGEALKKFLKQYESNPIDIETAIFDNYRKSVNEREFKWDD